MKKKFIIVSTLLLYSFTKKPITVKTSVYNPTTKQTDSTPHLTASGITIDTHKLRNNKLRYVSLSRDLAKGITYGKFVYIITDDIRYRGRWKFVDVMNSRFRRKIDFLQHTKDKHKPPTLIQIKL